MMSESLCGVKLWYYKVLLLLVECIWLKYQSLTTSSRMHMTEISKVYTYAEIKTTLKLSHQIWDTQSRLWSVAPPCSLVLPHQLIDTFYIGLDIVYREVNGILLKHGVFRPVCLRNIHSAGRYVLYANFRS